MRNMLVFVLLLILVVPTHAAPFDFAKFFNELFFPTGKVLQATVCEVNFLYKECTACRQSAELWHNTCSGYEHKNYAVDEACTAACPFVQQCNEDWSCLDSSTKLLVSKDCSISKLRCNEGETCKDYGDYVRCETSCTPEWECGTWSTCTDDKKQRTCVDVNSCGDVNSYIEKTECGRQQATEGSLLGCTDECTKGEKQCSENGYITCGNYDPDSCLEWKFTECTQGESCKDYKNNRVRCEGPCEEEWVCDEWSSCANGRRQRICYDINACNENDFTVEKERCGIFEDIAKFFKRFFG